ncbi:RCC1 domain-containing protein [Hyalangium versicolor]|uniref:RCC1 domain-containing protein n=1 Tax=Hyalangium versicolor TaxID=2861190 RepID=UPI001CCABE03|nr:hypothetical protein [Hyalangium versicolor]
MLENNQASGERAHIQESLITRPFVKSTARSVLAAVMASGFMIGCGGVSESSSEEVGQVEQRVAAPIPGQVSFTGLTPGATVEKVAAGNGNGFAWTSDGNRWGWGFNAFGQAGTTVPASPLTPQTVVSGFSNVTQFKGGRAFFAAALSSTGQVLTIGLNSYGQLGNGTTSASTTPVVALSGATAVAAGTGHTVALKSDGTLWAWGDNFGGELGDGTSTSRLWPVQVTGLSGVTITAIAAGDESSFALDSAGDVWHWGRLGGTGVTVPTKLTGISSVKAISANQFVAVFLKTDGTVSSLGTFSGTLSSVTGLPTVKAVAAGDGHFLAAGQDGTLWSWGSNSYGQLGDGTTTDRASPVQVVASTTPGSYLTGVASIAAGSASSYAILDDGTLWSWGSDGNGNIGR